MIDSRSSTSSTPAAAIAVAAVVNRRLYINHLPLVWRGGDSAAVGAGAGAAGAADRA
jgi:hypothetical protein